MKEKNPMAEEKQKHPKLTRLIKVFDWITGTILVLFIIGGIVLRAPWKLIAVLIAALLISTIIPKPARKWIWLTVVIIVIGLVIWVFLPNKTEGWKPYTFDAELAALEAQYAIPPQENAATIYNKLLEGCDPNTLDPDLESEVDNLTSLQPWSSADYPELAKWLQQHQHTIATLLHACQMEKCHFLTQIDIDMTEQLDRNSMMRDLMYLLIRAGNNDIGDGRIDEGLQKLIAALQIAKHMRQQPLLIDMLVGYASESLAISRLKRFIVMQNPEDPHLTLIEKALAKIEHNGNHDFSSCIEFEKLFMKNLIAFCYEVNLKGKTRLSRNPLASQAAQFGIQQNYWLEKLTKAATILSWFFIPGPQEMSKLVDNAFEKYSILAKPDFDCQEHLTQQDRPPLKLNFNCMIERLVYMAGESYFMVHGVYLQHQANKKASSLIIALRRYKNKNGNWPETLDDIKNLTDLENLIDPINNGPFVYKLTDENFTLYSKGKNNIDEDGRRKWSLEEKGPDDRLFWPLKSAKKDEKKSDAE